MERIDMLEAYVVVDLEMTGIHPKADSIIEIGAVKVKPDGMETFQTLVHPRKPIPDAVVELTGITNAMVESAPSVDTAMEAFLAFAEELPLVGHMVITDYAFLKQWAINTNHKFQRDGLDTVHLSRKFQPELERHTLEYLTDYYDIQRDEEHRALDDAMATNILYRCLATEFEAENPKDFKARPLIYKAKKQTPITVQQVRYLKEFCNYHQIPMVEHVENLTRSEASRLTDQYIQKYGAMIRKS